jgi:hypothetical protein
MGQSLGTWGNAFYTPLSRLGSAGRLYAPIHARVILLGFENAGKTTLLYKMKGVEIPADANHQTITLNVENDISIGIPAHRIGITDYSLGYRWAGTLAVAALLPEYTSCCFCRRFY